MILYLCLLVEVNMKIRKCISKCGWKWLWYFLKVKAKGGCENILKAFPCLQVLWDVYPASKLVLKIFDFNQSEQKARDAELSQEEPAAVERMVEVCANGFKLKGCNTFLQMILIMIQTVELRKRWGELLPIIVIYHLSLSLQIITNQYQGWNRDKVGESYLQW